MERNQIHYYCGYLLAYCSNPGQCDDCVAIGGMNEWQGKPAQCRCPPQIPYYLTRARTRASVGTRGLTVGATQPHNNTLK
jgi:hypothetical protein